MSSYNTYNTTTVPTTGTISTTAGTWITTDNYTISANQYSNWEVPQSELSNLGYSIKFSYDKDDLLSSNIESVKNNHLIFNCELIEKHLIFFRIFVQSTVSSFKN